jgi:predicted kinase
VLDYYLYYRACVRGKVLSIKAGDRECPEADRAAAERDAGDYFALAAGYAMRRAGPRMVVTCGPIASGKSTAAGWIADRLGFQWLRSDLERKRMAGMEPTERLPEEEQAKLYNEEMDRRTYGYLLDRAREALGRGRPVVLDATYQRREDREAVRRMAEEAGTPCRFLFFDAAEEVLAERLKRREGRRDQISDARAGLLPRHLSGFEFPEAGEPDLFRLDSSGDKRAKLTSVLDALITRS